MERKTEREREGEKAKKKEEIELNGMLSTRQQAFTPTKLIHCLAIPAWERFVRYGISDVHGVTFVTPSCIIIQISPLYNKYKLARFSAKIATQLLLDSFIRNLDHITSILWNDEPYPCCYASLKFQNWQIVLR